MGRSGGIDISVIIVSWNVSDYLKRCLDSIYKNSFDGNFEVFVVDNASSDDSVRMVRELYPRVILIENRENAGFAKANNIAITRASGRYILFLNPDTEIFGNTFQRVKDIMDGHTGWAGMGPRLINSDGSLQKNCRHFPSLFTDLMENLYLDWIFPRSPFFNYYRMGAFRYDRITPVDVPYGACFIVRRAVLEDTGLMDEKFFMYYDEIDLCFRMKKKGYIVYFIPDVSVIHHCNKSSDQILPDVSVWKQMSRAYFFKKHYGRFSIYALLLSLSFKIFIVWAVFGISNFFITRPKNIELLKREALSMLDIYARILTDKEPVS